MKEIFVIVFTIIGALIGAGFASGQELYSFFYIYGIKGIYGIIVTSFLITILIYKILKIIYIKKITNYDEFLSVFIKNKKITKMTNLILNILLLVTFYIMIAGFGAYFEQEIGINKMFGSLILIIMCFCVFQTSVEGVIKISRYIVPILILAIIVIGLINLLTINNLDTNIIDYKTNWLLSSITYSSYNIILLIPVLISLKNQIKREKNIKYIAIISGAITAILAIIIYTLLMRIDIDISKLEMPVVYMIRTFYEKFKTIYAFIILVSIFTTAISIGTGLLQNLNKKGKSYTQFVIFLCITSLIISNFGFSNLVKNVYPFFGYIGIIQIVLILSKNICKK